MLWMFPTGQQYWRPKMATSILRLGRLGSLKGFQSQSWMVWRNRSVASFCTQAEPPKRPKKTQTASKTVAPDERASLLAYRTAVTFPVKVSETAGFPVHSAGVTAAGSGAAASAEPRDDPPTTELTSSEPADEAVEESSSSSSSSSSDSDSDSDSDDELSQAKTQISEATMKRESGDRKVTSKPRDDAEESKPNYDRGSARETDKFVVPTPEICSEGTRGAAAGAVSGAPAEAEEPGTSPESTEVAVSPAGPDVPAEDVSTASPPADDSADVPAGTKGSTSVGSPPALAVQHGEAADGAAAEAAEAVEGPSSPADAAVEPTEAGQSEASPSTESSEEPTDAAPVRAESVGEELQPEEAAAAAAAAAAPPEPEEPLDISTYKNYQHHSYHPFTFADMDVEMAKYRLPQPTANRH